MNNRQKAVKPEVPMSVMDAIYHRRAVRNYIPRTIARAVIRKLLDAAVHAPTAMHEEPWSFAVIQDKALLSRLSDSAKERVRSEAQGSDSHHAKHSLELVDAPDFHVFYNAGTLIVANPRTDTNKLSIYAKGFTLPSRWCQRFDSVPRAD